MIVTQNTSHNFYRYNSGTFMFVVMQNRLRFWVFEYFFLNEHNYYSMSRIFIFLQKSLIFVKMYRILSKTDILLLLIKQMGFKHSLIILQEQFLIAYDINIFLFLCVVLFALKIKKSLKQHVSALWQTITSWFCLKKDVLQHRFSFTFWKKIFLSKDNIIHE